MKKILLLALSLCLGFVAKAQTCATLLLYDQNDNKFYYLDSVNFGELDANTNYKIAVGIACVNNTQDTIPVTDTTKVLLTMADEALGEVPIVNPNPIYPDSLYAAVIQLSFNSNIFETGEAVLCAKVTGVGSKSVSDEGTCATMFATLKNTSIAEGEINNVNIYPNPVRDYLTIDNANNVNVMIYAANGQLIKTINNVLGNTAINMSELSSGLYFVKIWNENATRIEKIQVAR